MQEKRLQIYPNREKSFDLELQRLKKSSISHRNKELIAQFQNYLYSKNCGSLRVAKLSSQLRRICPKLNKDMDKVTRKDLTDLISLYRQDHRLSEATKADYKRVLKQFYKWLKEEDLRLESKEEVVRSEALKFYKFIETEVTSSYKQCQADPNTIITDEDCMVVLEKGCRTIREKAFVSLLHETGCRIGEFLNIKIGDIELKESHAEIRVDGKTGMRTIFVAKSIPHLLRHLDVHPFKENVQSYLWLSESQQNRNDPLKHRGSQKLIDKCFERATLMKKHNLHWFRHSRASLLAPKLTEAMLCKYMGWTIGSRQVRTYSHLSAKQLEDAILSMNGIKKAKEEQDKPLKCVCGTLNHSQERYCFRCFKPLKVETVIQDKELVDSEINKTVKFMMEMGKNPEMMKMFEMFKKRV